MAFGAFALGALPSAKAPALRAPAVGHAGIVLDGAPLPAPGQLVLYPTGDTAIEYVTAAFTTDLPDDRARLAVETAMAQIGLPYVWGGNGPSSGDAGFDCSGLTTFAYAGAGINLPRTAHTQYYAGPHVPVGAPLQPGDLVFYGNPTKVHHVGMYIGAGRMVNAPTFGQPVQTAYYRWRGDDYLGATRPAATGRPSTGLLPYLPPPASTPTEPAAPPVFEAPPAPLPSAPLPQPGDPQPPEADSAAAAIAGGDDAAAGRGAPVPSPSPDVVPPPTSDAGAATTTGPGTPETATQQPGTQQPDVPQPGAQEPGTQSVAPQPVPPTPATTPPTSVPPTSPSATPTPAPTSTPTSTSTPPPAAEQARSSTVTLAGSTVPVASVAPGADGLPSTTGIWVRPGRPVVRLGSAAVVGDVDPGSVVTVSSTNGSVASYTVRSRVSATTAEAADLIRLASSGQLIVLVPAGEGRWTVLTAS